MWEIISQTNLISQSEILISDEKSYEQIIWDHLRFFRKGYQMEAELFNILLFTWIPPLAVRSAFNAARFPKGLLIDILCDKDFLMKRIISVTHNVLLRGSSFRYVSEVTDVTPCSLVSWLLYIGFLVIERQLIKVNKRVVSFRYVSEVTDVTPCSLVSSS